MSKHADYVIIRGQVFRWEEKAPFVPSGKSVQGAIEYDRETALIKCHECGEWYKNLSSHVQSQHREHGISGYKDRHGLRLRTSLWTPEMRAHYRNSPASKNLTHRLGREQAFARHRKATSSKERINELGNCQAQTMLALQMRAIELGQRPSQRDVSPTLRAAAISRFGSWNKALQAAGIETFSPKHTKASLRESLIDFYVLNQRLPRRSDFGSGRLAHYNTYALHFGSFRNALADAGLSLVALPVLIAGQANAAD